MVKKILYLMHIDWETIKQRPQFIAEGLSEFYEMRVFFPVPYSKNFKKLFGNKNLYLNVFLRQLPCLPFYNRIKLFYKLNRIIWRTYFKFMLKKYNPDYIWITFPLLYDYISFYDKSKIIYDCMDDALAFDESFNIKNLLLTSEIKLIQNSSIIFVSADDLARKLDKREKCKDKIVLNRNAFDGTILTLKDNLPVKSKKMYKIGYVGAISSWFDFESLYHTLERHENIEYHLIGPIANKHGYHERIKVYGPVKHEDLYSYTKDFDCLIMPFKLNELIFSVDPVKLNEYINYNKPIISVYYDEIKRFSPFVSFYHDKEDLNILLSEMIRENFPKKYSNKQRIEFLKNNTWDIRIQNILKALRGI